MVCAWYIHEKGEKIASSEVSLFELFKHTGVEVWQLNLETYDKDGKLDEIRKERGYNYEDVIHICPKSLPDYEERVKGFETEHLHSEEEIRFVLNGTTYFDVRTRETDQWIRMHISPGDLIILPAGIYHRLTLIKGKTVKLLRLFQENPSWSCHNRPAADGLECRKIYLTQKS